jgi:hypothetical protein
MSGSTKYTRSTPKTPARCQGSTTETCDEPAGGVELCQLVWGRTPNVVVRVADTSSFYPHHGIYADWHVGNPTTIFASTQ